MLSFSEKKRLALAANKLTPTQRRVFDLALELGRADTFPGPTAINRKLGRTRAHENMLNKPDNDARILALRLLGYEKDEGDGRWRKNA